MTIAPYGSWKSPIAAADLVSTSNGIHHTYSLVEAGVAYWTQANPDGRVSLWSKAPDGVAVELTGERCVRNGNNEYGGGAWAVAAGIICYSDWPSGDLRIIRGGVDSLLASGEGNLKRYGNLSIYPEAGLVLAVLEEHRLGATVNSIVSVSLAEPGLVTTIVSGADFFAYPTLGPFGQLAWMEWDHPNMPWDSTRIMVADLPALTDSGTPENLSSVRQVSTNQAQSAVYPAWAPDGALIYLSDVSGYWNFWRWDNEQARPLHQNPYDFCGPIWVLDPVPFSIINAQAIGCSWFEEGISRVGILNFDADGHWQLSPLLTDAVSITLYCAYAAKLGFSDRPEEFVVIDWAASQTKLASQVLISDGSTDLGTVELRKDGYLSVAQPITWESPDGPVHAWYYPPHNPLFAAPGNEKPPVQVWSHGGPTAFSGCEYSLSVQYWTTRGIGIVDVNYSGSTGFGKAYRERLRGNWGIADVRDCTAAASALVDQGLADPSRISIRGGSAGGYTTLQALTTTDVFSAGISLYGIGELETMATDTHYFESRYLDGLVAPYPAERQVYLDRSPIFHLDGLNTPMLILQGADDKVVPPEQAYDMAAAVQAKGLTVKLIVFEGEGHGFRKAETIIATAEAALKFLGEVQGFKPAKT